MGDALSHAVVPGVAVPYCAGWPFAAGAFFTGLLAALGMGFVKTKTRLREDAVIGVVFTAFFALGLLLISLFPSQVDLRTIVFGNILGISDPDIWQVLIISAVTLAHARAEVAGPAAVLLRSKPGARTRTEDAALHFTLLTLLSATAVAALQTVGACLVVAMLVTPGATAYLLTDRFGKMIGIAVSMGVGTSLVGAYASYFFDGSTGGCIVTLQTLLFRGRAGLRAKARPARRARQTPRRSLDRDEPPRTLPVSLHGDAMLVGAMVGAVCAVLSCFLVLKGWSLMGDAISHAVLPGIVIAYAVGVPLALGAFASGLLCAVVTGYIKANSRVKEDTVMGVVFTGLFAFGLVLFTKVKTDLHLDHILFGNILGIEPRDLLDSCVVGGVTLVIVLLHCGATCCSSASTRVTRGRSGCHANLLYYLLLSLLAVTIVVSLKAVGIILVIAMLVTPGCIGYLLTDRFSRMLWIATSQRGVLQSRGCVRELLPQRLDGRVHRAAAGADLSRGSDLRAEARPARPAGVIRCDRLYAGCGTIAPCTARRSLSAV